MRFLILALLLVVGFTLQANACLEDDDLSFGTHSNFKAKIIRSGTAKNECTGLWLSYPKKKISGGFPHSISYAWLSLGTEEKHTFGTVLTSVKDDYLIPDQLINPENVISYFCLNEEGNEKSPCIF